MRPVTIGILSVVTALALVLRDVGFVNSLSGSMFGCLLLFVLPAVMNINTLQSKAKSAALSLMQKFEMGANYGMIGVGFVMTIIGIAVSVLSQMGKL